VTAPPDSPSAPSDAVGVPEPREVLLLDGSSVRLRAARPDDAERLTAFHRALSEETIHFRYFSAMAKLPPLMLRRFTRVDFARDMVLLAEIGEHMIGLASYHREAPGDCAEVAFVVADEHHGRGVATLLLERLAELARARGIARFRADMLSQNRAMLRVFRDAGFGLEPEPTSSIVRLRFPLAETPSTLAAHERRAHVAEATSIARLLAPRAILLAGERVTDAGALRAAGFRGELFTELAGLPHGIELALFAGSARALPELVEGCAAAGVHALLVGALRDQPPEAERAAFDRELRVATRRNGMRLLGPESLGLANTAPEVSLHALAGGRRLAEGSCGLASDSPELTGALLAAIEVARLGVSTFAALGRRADVSANDLLQFWHDDARTERVLLALESLGNARKFAPLAARLAAKKSVLALATRDAARDDLCRRAGIELADSPAELVARARARD
jgi:GNAT superfamily N-acetyltransferase